MSACRNSDVERHGHEKQQKRWGQMRWANKTPKFPEKWGCWGCRNRAGSAMTTAHVQPSVLVQAHVCYINTLLQSVLTWKTELLQIHRIDHNWVCWGWITAGFFKHSCSPHTFGRAGSCRQSSFKRCCWFLSASPPPALRKQHRPPCALQQNSSWSPASPLPW